jgi:VanZ family protein
MSSSTARSRLLVWALFLVAWTTALLTPIHVSETSFNFFGVFKAVAAKTLHVGAYATLTVLTGRLGASPAYRLLLLFLILAHGPATEFLQTYVETRHGSLRDVCIDYAGVLLGLYLGRREWTQGMTEQPASPENALLAARHGSHPRSIQETEAG